MKNLLCIISNSLTMILSIISMVMINQVEVNFRGQTLVDIERSDYKVLIPMSLILASSILITGVCMTVKHKVAMHLMVIVLGIIMMAASITLMVRVEKHDMLEVTHNESQVKAMRVFLYLTASFGILTSLICIFKGAYKMNKIVNKK